MTLNEQYKYVCKQLEIMKDFQDSYNDVPRLLSWKRELEEQLDELEGTTLIDRNKLHMGLTK